MDVIWIGFRNMVFDMGGAILRFMIQVAQGVAEVFIQALEIITLKIGWMMEKLLGVKNIFDDMRDSIKQITVGADHASRNAALARSMEFEDAVTRAAKTQSKQAKMWDDVRADVVQDDAFMKMVELMGGDANVESAESGVAKSIKDSVKAVQELGASEPVAAAAGGTSMATGQFREISLRRTSLAQSAPTMARKQEVHDETVAGKLDDINQTLKDKQPAPAVLG